MPRIATSLLIAASGVSLSHPAVAQDDALALLERLDTERCTVETGQITADPVALMRELFQPDEQAQILEYPFDDELWAGQSGVRSMERFLIFRPDGDQYRLVDCLPFRPYGRSSVTVEGSDAELMSFGIYDETPSGYDRFNATYVLEGERRILHTAEVVSPLLYAAEITEWTDPIDDPWAWAEARFGIDLGATRDSIWGFEIDLNGDGRPELGITSAASHGTAGGSYAFFGRDDGMYRFIGYLELRTLQVLAASDDGSPRLRTFWRTDINCGSARTWTNDGIRFELIDTTDSCADPASYAEIAAAGEIIRPELHQFRPAQWNQPEP